MHNLTFYSDNGHTMSVRTIVLVLALHLRIPQFTLHYLEIISIHFYIAKSTNK